MSKLAHKVLLKELEQEFSGEIHKDVISYLVRSTWRAIEVELDNLDFEFDPTDIHPADALPEFRIPFIGKFAPDESRVNGVRVEKGLEPVTILVTGSISKSIRSKTRDMSGYAKRETRYRGEEQSKESTKGLKERNTTKPKEQKSLLLQGIQRWTK